MIESILDMELAVLDWLDARGAWLDVCQFESNNPHCSRLENAQLVSRCAQDLNTATDILYAIFSEGYTDSEKAQDDFCVFERMLTQEQNKEMPHIKLVTPRPLHIGHA